MRFRRWCFERLFWLSVFLCAAALAAWGRNGGRPPGWVERFSGGVLPFSRDRWTLQWDNWRVALFAPPRSPPRGGNGVAADSRGPDAGGTAVTRTPGAAAATADSLVAELDDEALKWGFQNPWPRTFVPQLSPAGERLLEGHENAPAARAGPVRFERSELEGPLLAALDDPRRMVSAHVILAKLTGHDSEAWSYELPPPQYIINYAGLTIVLKDRRWAPQDGLAARPWLIRDYGSPRVDARNAAAVRDEWHRRLDVQVVSAPYWLAAIVTGAWPGLRLWRYVARRRELRRRWRMGLCPACGYDLRGTPGRCPECGLETVAELRRGGVAGTNISHRRCSFSFSPGHRPGNGLGPQNLSPEGADQPRVARHWPALSGLVRIGGWAS